MKYKTHGLSPSEEFRIWAVRNPMILNSSSDENQIQTEWGATASVSEQDICKQISQGTHPDPGHMGWGGGDNGNVGIRGHM